MTKDIGLLTTDDLRSPMSEVRCPSAKCRATGKMPVVPAPSGNECVGGGGICALRRRATGRLCVVIRGVVSDAVPCLFNGVICDLPFNVVGSPIEDYKHYSTFLLDLSIPPRGFWGVGKLCLTALGLRTPKRPYRSCERNVLAGTTTGSVLEKQSTSTYGAS